MKKLFKVLCLAAVLALLPCLFAGCGDNVIQPRLNAPPSPPQSESAHSDDGQVLHGEIMQLKGGFALIASENGELCSVSVSELPIFGEDGGALKADELEAGMLVDILFSGYVLAIYPTTLDAPEKLTVAGRSNGVAGLYFQAICDIIKDDPGLNNDISVVSVDLSGAANLTDAQREALVYMTGCELGCEWLSLSYSELCDEGYIDRDKLIFNDGILISAATSKVAPDGKSFTFNIQKWRSGLGALFYNDCAARLKDGAWSYSPGAYAIS